MHGLSDCLSFTVFFKLLLYNFAWVLYIIIQGSAEAPPVLGVVAQYRSEARRSEAAQSVSLGAQLYA